MSIRSLVLSLVCLACTEGLASETDNYTTVIPQEDQQVILHNPDMGWVLYENLPVDPDPHGSSTMLALPGEDFAAVDNVAIMFCWSDVETSPGRYDFSTVDRAYDYWKARGKQIQLRMSAETLLWWNRRTAPTGIGVPTYVLDHLDSSKKQVRKNEGIEYVVVDASDAFYQDRLKRFLSEIASHFDSRRPVTLIDLRGFGLWGEWHSGFRYFSLELRRSALTDIIGIWSQAFPKHDLALSGSYDPDSPDEFHNGPTNHYDPAFTRHYDDFLRYSAFDIALKTPNVTFRRDGVGGAVHSNERRLNQEAFDTLEKGPFVSEFISGYAFAKGAGPAWLTSMLDDALSLHPNYINLLGYAGPDALNFIHEQPELFARGLRQMGYRLVPIRIRYPAQIHSDEPVRIEMRWTNRGVGRAMQDFHLFFALSDADGKIVATSDAGASNANRFVKDKIYETTYHITFNRMSVGRYHLRFSLRDNDRAIQLPLPPAPDGFYEIGAVDLTNGI